MSSTFSSEMKNKKFKKEFEKESSVLESSESVAKKEFEDATYAGNLLAIIHGDGGHYTAKHGWKKSTDDAIKLYYKRRKL